MLSRSSARRRYSRSVVEADSTLDLSGLTPEFCRQVGVALGLECEDVAHRCTSASMAIARPRALHLADSGAALHAVNDMRYVVSGSLRANDTA